MESLIEPDDEEELRQIAARYGLPPNTSREALQRVVSRLPPQQQQPTGEREGLLDDDSAPSTSGSGQRQQAQFSSQPAQQFGELPEQQQQQQQQFVMTTTFDNVDGKADRAVLDSLLRSLSSTGQLNGAAMMPDRRRAMTPNPQMARRPQSAIEYERQFQDLRSVLARKEAETRASELALNAKEEEIRSLKARVTSLAREKAAIAAGAQQAAVKRMPKSRAQALVTSTKWEADLIATGPGKGTPAERKLAVVMKSFLDTDAQLQGALLQLAALQQKCNAQQLALEQRDRLVEQARAANRELEERVSHEDSARSTVEAELARERELRKRAEERVEALGAQLNELGGEMSAINSARGELLQRTVKRDHKIAALNARVVELQGRADAADRARAKAEGELASLAQRHQSLRRRAEQLEARLATEEAEMSQALIEVQIKEEECRLMASLVKSQQQQQLQQQQGYGESSFDPGGGYGGGTPGPFFDGSGGRQIIRRPSPSVAGDPSGRVPASPSQPRPTQGLGHPVPRSSGTGGYGAVFGPDAAQAYGRQSHSSQYTSRNSQASVSRQSTMW